MRGRCEEVPEQRPRDVQLADHLARPVPVVPGHVGRELVPVGEIDLAGGREVVLRVDVVGERLVVVGELEQAAPVLGGELVVGAERRLVGHGSVAGADTALEEVG